MNGAACMVSLTTSMRLGGANDDGDHALPALELDAFKFLAESRNFRNFFGRVSKGWPLALPLRRFCSLIYRVYTCFVRSRYMTHEPRVAYGICEHSAQFVNTVLGGA